MSNPGMSNTFIVTEDLLGRDYEDEPYGWPFDIGRKQPDGWQPFELYDDDKELYFKGYARDDEEVEGFLDAWSWGAWFAGCTLLKSRGDWVIG